MSVNLLTAPSEYSFSKDFITATFQCTNHLQQSGVKAVNVVSLAAVTKSGVAINIKYGNHTVSMISSYQPDESGNQFLCANGSSLPAANVVDYFKSNYQLNNDFDIDFTGYDIVFTAREKAIGFNFTSGGTNTVAGSPDIVKPNYTVYFALFLENATHTSFDKIYSTNLQLQIDGSAVAVAQLSDKIHQKLSVDLDLNGIEIPTTGVFPCKRSARRYYFTFAESYGETISVRKLTNSQYFNVIFGGQSYQGKNNNSIKAILNPSTAAHDRFLKQGNARQYTREEQPQFLYFYNVRIPYSSAKLIVKRTFIGGNSDMAVLEVFNMEKSKKYGFNVSYGNVYHTTSALLQYEIYLVNNADERISEKQTFVLKSTRESYVRYFMNLSSWGTMDSRCFTGKGQVTLEIDYAKAKRISGQNYKLIDGLFKVFGKSLTTKFSATTGFVDPSIIANNKDFFLSSRQFRYLDNTILPIEVTSTNIDNPEDGNFLYAQSFEYQYLYSDDSYSEADIEDKNEVIGSDLIPSPIGPIIIYAGTPANPSLAIAKQQIP